MTTLYSLFLLHPIVTTDSRDCPEGSIFFALKGDNFDGNEYAHIALEKGCSYAVIDEAQYALNDKYIVVPDALVALQQLANEHRRALGTPIIGITGTNGKTTTKELVAHVLSKKFNVLYTQGNLNNHIGVPKTLLQLTKEHDIAVIEMGANHPGEIKTLADIVEPNYGIITNVGKAHLAGFGSLEGVIKTKGELYDKLRLHSENRVFLNADDSNLINISEGLTLIKYAVNNTSDDLSVHGSVVSNEPYLNFQWKDKNDEPHNIKTHLIGSYNIYNMLAAVTVGLFFKVSPDQIDAALTEYVPSNSRSQFTVTKNNKLIIDTYNANPTSMQAAISNFASMQVSPKMAILGDMLELGQVSTEEHQHIVDTLQSAGISNVWLVGEEFAKTQCDYRKFPNVESVQEAIKESLPTGQYILIKGSHSTRLYQLPELL